MGKDEARQRRCGNGRAQVLPEWPWEHWLAEFARRVGVSPPALYYSPGEEANAYACFLGGRPGVIVTRGLLERLTGERLAGVLAHELGHLGRSRLAWAAAETLWGWDTRTTRRWRFLGRAWKEAARRYRWRRELAADRRAAAWGLGSALAAALGQLEGEGSWGGEAWETHPPWRLRRRLLEGRREREGGISR